MTNAGFSDVTISCFDTYLPLKFVQYSPVRRARRDASELWLDTSLFCPMWAAQLGVKTVLA